MLMAQFVRLRKKNMLRRWRNIMGKCFWWGSIMIKKHENIPVSQKNGVNKNNVKLANMERNVPKYNLNKSNHNIFHINLFDKFPFGF